jgi:tetratricopeptide (TPR) repeat protein
MAGWNPRANELFLNALDIPSLAERQAYLETVCGADAPLRQAVEALLQAHAAAGNLLERPGETAGPLTGPAAPSVDEDRPGTLLAGRYKLLERIGEGGMGTVWMAEQLEPIRRPVALKLIKPGMGSAQVIARFEAERQALALMDHPNIARVLDAGTTETGRPFFVMELVKGVPITRYCDDNQLTPRERLVLMAPVCHAIQHAHQKGIIHRDLKPSNVLVASYDGKPVPKVIDFGIAKAVGQRLTERTLFTGFGSILGTLEYMSPEQAEFNALDIDTRSDVYSLGVVLYELLTGTTPLTRQRLEKAALLEVLRLIREEEPPPPSTRIRMDEGGRMKDEKKRQANSLSSFLLPPSAFREVDWIVMKALAKDRSCRYETADALARDIERYLRGDVVEAGPPSTAYRMRKFVARHRTLVVAAALVVLALTGGVIGTTWGLLRALAAEKTAHAESQRADAEKEKALAAAADTKAFSDFLLFQVLAAARRKGEAQQVPMTLTIAEAVAEAEKNIDQLFKDRPTAEADVRHALGVTWRNLGKFDAAAKDFRRALELRRQHLGPEAPPTLSSQRCLGATLDEGGHTREAVPILEDARKHLEAVVGSDDKETLLCLNNLGLTYTRMNRPADAAPLFAKALQGMKVVDGPTHPETLLCMKRLADAYNALKAFDQATPVLEELLTLQTKIPQATPFDDPALPTMQYLAIAYAEEGRVGDLRALLKEYFERQPMAMAPKRGDPRDDGLLAEVGSVLLRKGQYVPAEEFLRDCLKIREGNLADAWRIASARSLLGGALLGQKKYADAAPLLLQGYEGLRKDADKIPAAVRQERQIEALDRLVQLYESWDRKSEADTWRKKLDEAKAAAKPQR